MLKKFFIPLVISIASVSLGHAEKAIGLDSFDRFVANDDVVIDRATQLTWRTCSVGQERVRGQGCFGKVSSMSWESAIQQQGSEWRLPTRGELVTLIDGYRSEGRSPVRIEYTVFLTPDKTKLNYWTSDSAGENKAWYVNFGLGPMSAKADKNSQFAVRLVKGNFVPPAPEIKPPKDIETFIGRRDSCEHFAGEEAYDDERGQYLDRMLTKLRCNNVVAEEKRLRKKYKDRADMLKWLDDRPE